MKVIIFFTILFFSYNSILSGQEDDIYEVKYFCTTKITKGRSQDGENTLYFSGHKLLYVHDEFPIEDDYKRRGNFINYIKGDNEGLPVYMDHLTNEMIYKSEYSAPPGEIFILQDTIPHIEWEILEETKPLDGYTCQKARGEYGGRKYEVWFTPDIPVPYGPYKLNGLPGLILQATSLDGFVDYDLLYVVPDSLKSNDISIEPPKNGTHMTWEEIKDHVITKLLRVEARSHDDVTVTNNDPSPNAFIEKNKWTIISEYKAERAEKRRRR